MAGRRLSVRPALLSPILRPALLLLVAAAGAAVPWTAGRAAAQPLPEAGVALLFLVDRVPFEAVMAVPEFRALAATGGVALMTTETGDDEPKIAGYAALGAGSTADGADPGLLARALRDRGIEVCPVGSATSVGAPFHPELRLAGARGAFGVVPCGGDAAEEPAPGLPGGIRTDPGPILDLVRDSSAAADRPGGGALVVIDLGDTLRVDREAPYASTATTSRFQAAALAAYGELVGDVLDAVGPRRTLAVVAVPAPSFGMDLAGDEVTPLVVAVGRADRLLEGRGAPRAATSDTTGLDGLVSNVDVAPTILGFFGLGAPREMVGRAVRPVDEPAPFGLHRRHLQHRRVRFPVQVGAGIYIAVAGITSVAALAALMAGARWGRRTRTFFRFLALFTMGLMLALLAAGTLSSLTYPVVVPFLVLGAAAMALLGLSVRSRGPMTPLAYLGAAGLGFVVLDLALGGPALRLPLLGGTAFDGVRYAGLPNAFIGLVLAGAVFTAATLDAYAGFVVVFGAGLLVGFPGLGENLGASVTLFVAAGLWWVLRTRGLVGLREAAFAGGVLAVGTGLVLIANRIGSDGPSHIGRFVQDGGVWRNAADTVRRRLAVGARQIAGNPSVLAPLVGLPAVVAASLRPGGGLRAALRPVPEWRDAVVVVAVASIASYFANDTGPAAAAPGFLYATAALAFIAATDTNARVAE